MSQMALRGKDKTAKSSEAEEAATQPEVDVLQSLQQILHAMLELQSKQAEHSEKLAAQFKALARTEKNLKKKNMIKSVKKVKLRVRTPPPVSTSFAVMPRIRDWRAPPQTGLARSEIVAKRPKPRYRVLSLKCTAMTP